MKILIIFLPLVLLLGLSVAKASAPDNPYATESMTAIKALSAEQIEGYYQGKGMGLAKAAELNGYPGPKHVLELTEKLELSAAQRAETEKVFMVMQQQASDLGQRIVVAEQELDKLFSRRKANIKKVQRLTSEIASLKGELRAVHLLAHIKQKLLMTEEQLGLYMRLRGYQHSGNHHYEKRE